MLYTLLVGFSTNENFREKMRYFSKISFIVRKLFESLTFFSLNKCCEINEAKTMRYFVKKEEKNIQQFCEIFAFLVFCKSMNQINVCLGMLSFDYFLNISL